MVRVRYKKYYHDWRQSQEQKCFDDLSEVADWMFGMVKGEYKRAMFFTNPDDDHMREGKLHLDSSCIQTSDGKWVYFIEQIEKDGRIIYSCGTFTNKVCHWNEEVKQWIKACRARMENPVFNFG